MPHRCYMPPHNEPPTYTGVQQTSASRSTTGKRRRSTSRPAERTQKLWRNPAHTTIDTPSGLVRPQKEMRWLGVHLDVKLSLATQAKKRIPKATTVTGLTARIN